MDKKTVYAGFIVLWMVISFAACKIPENVNARPGGKQIPASYDGVPDTASTAGLKWKDYFTDPYLQALVDTALANNQELNIMLQEIQVARNEVRARKGEYLPFIGASAGAGVDKAARYTNIGAMEANTEIRPGQAMPEPVPDLRMGLFATWEIDIWARLHHARRAAVARYLSTAEGKNFIVTRLVAEIANSYYELLALDNQLDIIRQNIEIQSNALRIVRLEKEAARVTELAVRKFEAEVLKTQGLQYGIRQQITEAENHINFLLGRYPQPVPRNAQAFGSLVPPVVHAGLPAQLLAKRPDIRQAEQDLTAAKLDVKVAKARFYPSLGISAGIGYRAFNPAYLLKTPESLLYSLAGDLAAPLINRNAIKAAYYTANARQIQAIYNYERTVLNAYREVANQLAKIDNLEHSYDLKSRQVQALTRSIDISGDLFRSARADYMEVLMTQRDVLESKFELIETRKQQMNSAVNIYQALGGGWN